MRLCLDPQELNKYIRKENVLIPTLDDVVAQLSGKKYFSVLDLKDGFWQVELDELSSNYCTFSTPFGCYKFNRLPFGLSMAPEYFQKINCQNFGDIEGVMIYIDDILVAGKTKEEHDMILNKVINRARELNVKFNRNKLQFCVNEMCKYLGQIFMSDGIKPDNNRVKAIVEMESPKNKKDLQRILGMINYLRQYLPCLSEKTSLLRELLKENVEFVWLSKHEKMLNEIKNLIVSAPILGTFDANKEVTIQTDASQNGLGCGLMQEGRPIYYASRSLTETENKYAMI